VAELVETLCYKPENRKPHCGPGVNSASKRNEYQIYFLGVKAAGADCHEIWELQPPGTVRVSPGLYRDCFIFHILSRLHYDIIVNNLIPKADVHRRGVL
jgi:hypothetical protein